MSDLIDRQKALDGLEYEMKYGADIDRCGLDTAYDIIENISSAEPERTAKVERTSVKNTYKCSNCGKPMHPVDFAMPNKYCGFCGSKLDWSE